MKQVPISSSASFAIDKLPSNWVEQQFPKMTNCAPPDKLFYYDIDSKKSKNGILESEGYSSYKVNKFQAFYRIDEKFYGLNAIELGIPSSTYALFTVQVNSDVKNLQKSIKLRTGANLAILGKGDFIQSGIPYLVSVNSYNSMFVCILLED